MEYAVDEIEALLGVDEADPVDRLAKLQADTDRGLFARLRAMRKELRGLTQQDIADRMGVDQGTVARIESGRRDIHMSTLRLYALALHVRIDHAIVDVEDPRTQLPRVAGKVLESNLDDLLRAELGTPKEPAYFVVTGGMKAPQNRHRSVVLRQTADV